MRVSYVRNQIITTDSRFVRVSYARNQVITTDSRSEGELRQKPGDHHRQETYEGQLCQKSSVHQTVDL